MKPRPPFFLDDGHIDHKGEVFDYIKELHGYLWEFVRIVFPGASGDLGNFVDDALKYKHQEKSTLHASAAAWKAKAKQLYAAHRRWDKESFLEILDERDTLRAQIKALREALGLEEE